MCHEVKYSWKRLLHRRQCNNSSLQSRKILEHKSVMRACWGHGKHRKGLTISIRVSVVIRLKFHLSSHIVNLEASATTWRFGPIAFPLAATIDGAAVASNKRYCQLLKHRILATCRKNLHERIFHCLCVECGNGRWFFLSLQCYTMYIIPGHVTLCLLCSSPSAILNSLSSVKVHYEW